MSRLRRVQILFKENLHVFVDELAIALLVIKDVGGGASSHLEEEF